MRHEIVTVKSWFVLRVIWSAYKNHSRKKNIYPKAIFRPAYFESYCREWTLPIAADKSDFSGVISFCRYVNFRIERNIGRLRSARRIGQSKNALPFSCNPTSESGRGGRGWNRSLSCDRIGTAFATSLDGCLVFLQKCFWSRYWSQETVFWRLLLTGVWGHAIYADHIRACGLCVAMETWRSATKLLELARYVREKVK